MFRSLVLFSLATLLGYGIVSYAEKSQSQATEAVVKEETFCVIGDTGTGRKNQYRVGTQMLESECKKIVLTGDVIYPRGVKSATDKQWKTKFEQPYADLIDYGSVFFSSLGNHDHDAFSDPKKVEKAHV
ncbi:MAG: metallophosphoesterase, partial [Pseudomonadota bacterium]